MRSGHIVHRNPSYASWIWRKVLSDNLEQAIRASAANLPDLIFRGCLNINCILFGERLMDACLPFAQWDEREINEVLALPEHAGIMKAQAVAHHYSFRFQQKTIDTLIGIGPVAAYCLDQTYAAPRKYAETRSVA